MKAYSDFRGFADPAETVVAYDPRSSFRTVRAATRHKMRNSRGLVVAVMMSAACWAAIGAALLM